MVRRSRKDRSAETAPVRDAFHLAQNAPLRPRLEIGGAEARETIRVHALRLLGEHGVAVVHEEAHTASVKAAITTICISRMSKPLPGSPTD